MSDKKLYFIAVIPPEPVLSDAAKWKQHFADTYHSKAALKSPPHITLHMPFKWREDREDRIFETVEKSLAGYQSFELALHGFGAFKPRVIFIHIADNEPLNIIHDSIKKHVKTELNIFNADHKDRGFNPHLTLAFRDLKKSMFFQAWKEFENKNYEATFLVDAVTLLKHNGKSWDSYKNFGLSK